MNNRPQPRPVASPYDTYNQLYNYFVGNYGEETAQWAMEYYQTYGEIPEGY